MKTEPRIVYSALSQQWFLLTKYRKVRGVDATTGERKNYLKAQEEHDITDQMVTIIREVERRSSARRKTP